MKERERDSKEGGKDLEHRHRPLTTQSVPSEPGFHACFESVLSFGFSYIGASVPAFILQIYRNNL